MICQHGRYRPRCKECGGSAICEHMRERRLCKQCGGKPRARKEAKKPSGGGVAPSGDGSEATLRRAADDVLGVTPPEKARQGAILEGLRTLGYLPPTTAELGGAVLAGGLVSDELGRHLQALSVTNVELGMFGEAGCVINIGEGVPLSCEHEQRVGRVLCAACDSLLAGFATPLHADEEALEAEPEGDHASRRLQLSIRSRLSRKRCLAACRASAAAWVERPTATGTLRRPWKVNIKTSG